MPASLQRQMGKRAPTVPTTDPPARSVRSSRSTYAQEIARLRRTKTAVLQSCSSCEDYLAHSDERNARTPELVD